MTLAAIVLTCNEETHLPDCLASLIWADERIVLDSGSSDGTHRIAISHGARLKQHPFSHYADQRQFALGLTRQPWVFFVDADERVTPELAAEVQAAVEDESKAGWWVPRRNIFWGHVIRGGGWWPDYQLRLFRRDRASFARSTPVHEVADVSGALGQLQQPLVHLNYDSLAEFRARQRQYALLEARRRRDAGLTPKPHRLVLQPLREFMRRFVGLGGWRDGPRGGLLCGLMGYYEWLTWLELHRLRRQPARAAWPNLDR
jgi:hypothetical protein